MSDARRARHARLRYWALIVKGERHGRYCEMAGCVQDFYPEEEIDHYPRKRGIRVLGTFDRGEDALAAVRAEIQRLGDERNRAIALRRERRGRHGH